LHELALALTAKGFMLKPRNSISFNASSAAAHAVYGYDIEKINVYQDRFIVGRTQATLLLGDLESCRLSEIPWESDLTEKFYFEHEKVNQLLRTAAMPRRRTPRPCSLTTMLAFLVNHLLHRYLDGCAA
jgi:hypothetical protein